jgi:hypothetical protein
MKQLCYQATKQPTPPQAWDSSAIKQPGNLRQYRHGTALLSSNQATYANTGVKQLCYQATKQPTPTQAWNSSTIKQPSNLRQHRHGTALLSRNQASYANTGMEQLYQVIISIPNMSLVGNDPFIKKQLIPTQGSISSIASTNLCEVMHESAPLLTHLQPPTSKLLLGTSLAKTSLENASNHR